MKKKNDKNSNSIIVSIDPSSIQQVNGRIQASLQRLAPAMGSAAMVPGAVMRTASWNYNPYSPPDEFREAVDHAVVRRKLECAEKYLIDHGVDLDEFYRNI